MKNSSGYCVVLLSPPSRWSGLKLGRTGKFIPRGIVSTLAVEWIEIYNPILVISFKMSPPSRWSGLKSPSAGSGCPRPGVSTLAVEWIEIGPVGRVPDGPGVSTLAVEWIEIWKLVRVSRRFTGLHPRGGVD